MKYTYYTTKKENRFTDSMKSILEKKLNKLEKYIQSDEAVKVTLDTRKNDEIIMKGQAVLTDNYHLRYEAKGFGYNEVAAKLYHGLKEEITSHLDKYDHKVEKIEYPVDCSEDIIQKEKHFILYKLSDEKAIEEMESLGFTFYLYRDFEDSICAVYQRFDGTYGKIVCK